MKLSRDDVELFYKLHPALLAYANQKLGVLDESFRDMFDWLPVMLEAVLLPFKGRIIYDGMLRVYRVFSGSGFRRRLEEDYREAKLKYGVITSLPFQGEERKLSDEERLRLYMRSRDSRERHWEEIWGLIEKNPELLTVYHQEMGKHDARSYGRQLRRIGLRDAWFAVLEGVIPEEKRGFAYVFHLKR